MPGPRSVTRRALSATCIMATATVCWVGLLTAAVSWYVPPPPKLSVPPAASSPRPEPVPVAPVAASPRPAVSAIAQTPSAKTRATVPKEIVQGPSIYLSQETAMLAASGIDVDNHDLNSVEVLGAARGKLYGQVGRPAASNSLPALGP